MKNETDLIKLTEEFFFKYWNASNGKPPQWTTEHWHFNSEISNQTQRGCYGLFKESELIYIGIGIGKSFGNYSGCGLGDRLKRYYRVNKIINSETKYIQTDDWNEITSIATIGFDEEHYYLAAALELYLINKLNPPRNSNFKNTKNNTSEIPC